MRYRCDYSEKQQDGATLWFARWLGGPSLAKVENCRLANMAGDMRRNVIVTGQPDTLFSVPAFCRIAGVHVRGYVTFDDEGNAVFRQQYF